ncbi:NAD(+) synthase [Herbivorax sp. ANBcel31]|uniref:NAD(+) synthase n=1 Tax=Herbivorax sp. ANBcel31 TaxID=3069754 RepID=UPI0027AF56C0|nr:NAD(+) synthase [Herbivorax sp. ANBcel31]MDQ2087098.1 NAD(+) synthase [Herbivorax sp. ANBcel31]
MKYGFVRLGSAVPKLKVADCEYNSSEIINVIKKGEEKGIKILVFPELSITSYTCGDLFYQDALQKDAFKCLYKILDETKDLEIISLLGIPVLKDNQLFNCAVVIQKGKVLGIVPKTYIPNYSEFYEGRCFSSAKNSIWDTVNIFNEEVPFGADLLFEDKENKDLCFGIEVCEDLWSVAPPSCFQAMHGATIIFNLSASNEIVGKYEYRKELVNQQSARCIAGYVYSSSGIGESTTDLVFGGHCIISENGTNLCESERFVENQLIYSEVDLLKIINHRRRNTSYMEYGYLKDMKFRKVQFELKHVEAESINRYVPPHPFVPCDTGAIDKRCSDVFRIQTTALAKRMKHAKIEKAVLGISGGLDSTLALLVTVKTFDYLKLSRKNIIAVTMPGFGTTDETYKNAVELIKSLDVTMEDIDIKTASLQHFKDIGHDPKIHDVTYENVQSRERTQIIMDIANKEGGFVVGTGDMSELALGWCTYNGDHMSMYSVNSGIPKTLVSYLVSWAADNVLNKKVEGVLKKILETPISPELLPPDHVGKIKQKTEDLIGPYELHDFFLYHMLRYGATPSKILFLANKAFVDKYAEDEIKKWLTFFLKRFFSQQFKRSSMPDGPKVGTISLSPRGDWRMPSDAQVNSWINELNNE